MMTRLFNLAQRIAQPWREMPWVLLIIVFLAAQGMVSAVSTPLGYAPDEAAHLSYVRDSIQSPTLMPDYAAGQIMGFRSPNYLAHPPLYYSALGLVGKVFHLEPKRHYLVFRSLGVLFVGLGLVFMALGARALGIAQGPIALTLLACAAVPMFPYIAGSVSNDTMLYLGVALAFYGLALSLQATARHHTHYQWPLLIGLLITFLTKATGMAFLVFFFLIYATVSIRRIRPAPLLANAWRPALAFMLLVGTYYVATFLTYGSVFPRAGNLYDFPAPPDLMGFQGYAGEFFGSMWRRLPGIVSHLSVAPMPPVLAPAFYGMLMLPLVGWLIVRFSSPLLQPKPDAIRLFDAMGLAAVATMTIHLVLGYRTYTGNGVLSGFQPRYYAYFLPLMWFPFFVLCRAGWFRQTVTGLFALSAVVAFWGTVPYVQLRQQEALQSIEQGFVYNAPAGNQRQMAALNLRESTTGNLDDLSWQDGVLRARGWVFDNQTSQPVPRVWVLAQDQLLTTVKVQASRPDVVTALGQPGAEFAGFSFALRGLPVEWPLCQFQLIAEFRDGSFGRLPMPGCPVDN
jgi:hypothetical protein